MKKESIKLMKIVTKTLESMSEQQLNQLIEGQAKLIYQEIKKTINEPSTSLNHEFYLEYYKKLKQMKSREEVKKYLNKLKKKEIIEFAQVNKINIRKSDTKEKIVNKLVELIIGAKLRYEAIRTIDI